MACKVQIPLRERGLLVRRLHAETGLVVLVAAISPTHEIRAVARSIAGADDYLECS
jgi:adenylylsulfate kinase-like enzyme